MSRPTLGLETALALVAAARERGWIDDSRADRIASSLRKSTPPPGFEELEELLGIEALDVLTDPDVMGRTTILESVSARATEILSTEIVARLGRWRRSLAAEGRARDGEVDRGADIPRGAVLRSYRIERRIGRGGMGTVYLAMDLTLNRRTALKVIPSSADPILRRRFEREATAMGGLVHPHIVRVHAAGFEGGYDYIAMEYVDGPDLAKCLAKGDLEREDVAKALRDMARALGHAHSHGVLHRDVKPSNILFDSSGISHLSDFGLARRADLFDSRLTEAGVVIGTPAYMSPEQICGSVPLDPRADVYSLGATLYQGLTGEHPHEGGDFLSISRSILRGEVVPPREIDPSIPADLEAICLIALSRDRDHRYADGDAMADDFDRLFRGEPIAGAAPPTRPFASRPPQGPVGPPTKKPESPSAQRRRSRIIIGAAVAIVGVAGWVLHLGLGKWRMRSADSARHDLAVEADECLSPIETRERARALLVDIADRGAKSEAFSSLGDQARALLAWGAHPSEVGEPRR